MKKLSLLTACLSASVFAAPISLPTDATTDLTTTISNGGVLAITAALAIAGYIILVKMIKKH